MDINKIIHNEKVKKGFIFSLLGILFLLSMWFIFAPSDREQTKLQQGLNDKVPQANVERLTENKLKHYELGDIQSSEEQNRQEMAQLSDYLSQEEDKEEGSQKTKETLERSAEHIERNKALINSFYEQEPYDYEKEELQREVEELKERLAEEEAMQDDEAKQLEMMEKSYELAARYLPQSNQGSMPKLAEAKAKAVSHETELPNLELIPQKKSVVSNLTPVSDSLFVAEYGKGERNLGFHSIQAKQTNIEVNTLKVIVDKTTCLQEGDYLGLRLLDDVRLKGIVLPKHTPLIAKAKIEGKRMFLLINKIEIAGRILSVKLSAFDLDGQEGIFIPQLPNLKALKEVGANLGGSMGSSFTFSSSAKDQIISEATRSVMQGAKQLLQKKLRTVKLTVKGGYRLFLVQTK